MSKAEVKQETDGINDPDDYRQRQRIQAILEARETVLQQRRKALDKRVSGEISPRLAQRMLREAVEAYILESEQVIRSYLPETDDQEEWDTEEQLAHDVWEDAELGEIPMRTRAKTIRGLSEYVDADEEFVDKWSEESTSHVRGAETTVQSETYQITMEVSKEAYRQLNRFWSQMGMDLEMSHKMPTDTL